MDTEGSGDEGRGISRGDPCRDVSLNHLKGWDNVPVVVLANEELSGID